MTDEGNEDRIMKMYNATIDVALRDELTAAHVDELLEQLADYHPSLSASPRGWQSVTITVPAETIRQAFTTALAVVEAEFTAPALAVELMPTEEFDARQGWAPVPELVSVSEAAELLGVSRQRVLQRIESKSLPATRVGRDWVIPQSAVTAAKAGGGDQA